MLYARLIDYSNTPKVILKASCLGDSIYELKALCVLHIVAVHWEQSLRRVLRRLRLKLLVRSEIIALDHVAWMLDLYRSACSGEALEACLVRQS